MTWCHQHHCHLPLAWSTGIQGCHETHLLKETRVSVAGSQDGCKFKQAVEWVATLLGDTLYIVKQHVKINYSKCTIYLWNVKYETYLPSHGGKQNKKKKTLRTLAFSRVNWAVTSISWTQLQLWSPKPCLLLQFAKRQLDKLVNIRQLCNVPVQNVLPFVPFCHGSHSGAVHHHVGQLLLLTR